MNFYGNIVNDNDNPQNLGNDYGKVMLVPRIIMHEYIDDIKLEFKIGTKKQLYKVKDIIELYRRIKNKEFYKYGAKLEFLHDIDAFESESKNILNYFLKYAEIMDSMKENKYSGYRYYGQSINYSSISLNGGALEEFFEILKDTYVEIENDYTTSKILLCTKAPDIKFEIEKVNSQEYIIHPNIDVYDSYKIIKGKENVFMIKENRLYRCNKQVQETTLKLLNVFKKNITQEIRFPKEYFESFFSIVMPKMRDDIVLDKIETKEIEQYIPKKLGVKLYLDYDEANNIVLNVRFCYGDVEINPLNEEEKVKIARNIVSETESLNMFARTGFLLDKENKRLILADEEKIYNFLTDEIEIYMNKFEVLATESFKQKEVRQPKIGTLGVKIENNLLQVDLSKIQIDKSELSEILKKYELKKKYHRLKNGTFINIDDNEDIKMLNRFITGLELTKKDLEKQIITLPVNRSMYLDRILNDAKDIQIEKNDEYKNLTNQIGSKGKESNIEIPQSLDNTLRYYQKTGFKWLKTLDNYKFGGILADDMGLGKTIQMLSIILAYIENTDKKDRMPSLVVAPSSLALNWKNEAEKFTKDIKTVVISGKMLQRHEIIRKAKNYDLLITSYDLLKRDIDIYTELNCEFRYMLADEAQYMKNSNTQNAKAIKKINAQTRYALTGTPIENSLAELWSIFDYIMPGYLFSYKKFKEYYETPIIKENDQIVMEKLKMLIEPFILRRTKKEVLTELPDKTITIMNNEMTKEQSDIYLSYLAQAKKELQDEFMQKGFEKSHIKILALLTRLRQICCHPSLFIANYENESGKLNQCIELIKDAVDGNHKILLFSGYTSMFEIIEKELKKENIKYFKLTGKTKVDERIELVEEFNKNSEIKVFLISLKAGGTGLNLTGADMVIHYDPWWNLSVENQATDRAYRIGQKNNVQVYKLITKNSIEEKIYEIQQRKANLVDNMLDTKTKFVSQLSKEEVMSLFE